MIVKIRTLLKDHLGSLIFGFIGLAVLLVFDLYGFRSDLDGLRSDFKKSPGEFLFTPLFLLVVVEWIFLLGKLRYIEGLEDTIRYLNAKFELYKRVTSESSYKNALKPVEPVDKEEAEPWTVEGATGMRMYLGQSNYEKAVFNSRKRLKKRLEKARMFEPLVDKKLNKYAQKKVEDYKREIEKKALLLDKRGGTDGNVPPKF